MSEPDFNRFTYLPRVMEQAGAQNRNIEMTLSKRQIRQMRLRMAQIVDHAIPYLDPI